MAVFTGTDALLRRTHNWNVSGSTIGTNRVGATVYALFQGATISATMTADAPRVVGWQINDSPFQYRTLANGSTTFSLATGLPAGNHRLRLFYDGRGTVATNRWDGRDVALVSLDTGSLTALPTAPTKNLFIFGDSIMEASRDTGLDTHANSPSMAIYEALNDQYQVTNYSLGGTGYLSTGANSLVPLSGSRNLAWSGTSFTARPDPDVVLITMGTNDGGSTDAALQSAVASTIGSMLTDFATATFFIQIPIGGIKRSAISAGALSLGSTRVKVIDCGTYLQRGLSAGADTYYSSDAVHPSPRALQAYTARTLFDIAAGLVPAGGGGGATDLTPVLSAIANIPTAVWGHGTKALTDKAGFELTPAERVAIGTANWSTTIRALTAPVTTDAASRTASQANVSLLATTAQLTAAQNAIITQGNSAWGGSGTVDTAAIATAVQNQIKPQLDTIEDLAELSALPITADSIVINSSSIATYTQGGVPKHRVQLLDALGDPTATEVRQQIKLPV
jgi:hypothetical protein